MSVQDEMEKGKDGTCDTIVVKTKAGDVRINVSDFDASKHQKIEPEKVKSTTK